MKRLEVFLHIAGWRGRIIGMLLGGVAVLGLAPFHIWPLTLICLAVLLARLNKACADKTPLKTGFSVGFWFGFGYFLVGTVWIGSAFIARGPAFIPAMPPMVLGLAALLAFFWGISGAMFTQLNLKGGMSILAFAALFSAAMWEDLICRFRLQSRTAALSTVSTFPVAGAMATTSKGCRDSRRDCLSRRPVSSELAMFTSTDYYLKCNKYLCATRSVQL